MDVKQAIIENKTSLGIELGSTRIKAVLIDDTFAPVAQGSHEWENRLEDGVWTYHLNDVWKGLQDCFKDLALDVKNRYGLSLSSVGAIGVSAMMHGYLVFNKNGDQLVPFRTWRNTTTEKAASLLTEIFKFNIPQRWSIAHLYQAFYNGESHVINIDFITTLAGYVHWKLTGKKTLGIGDASGMFPTDGGNYNPVMLKQFDELIASSNYKWKISDILPAILNAGENAGILGVTHTHSPYAAAWAQTGKPIPVFGTTHSDNCAYEIPCTAFMNPQEIKNDYELETGNLIVNTFKTGNLDFSQIKMTLVAGHGPFTWGNSASQSVYHSVILEEISKMALFTVTIKPDAAPLPEHIIRKHWERKHGVNAYYGQK